MPLKSMSLHGGEIFGRLTVIDYSHSVLRANGKAGERIMNCLCKCGATAKIRTSNLKSGNTQSCGCFHSDQSIKSNIARKI